MIIDTEKLTARSSRMVKQIIELCDTYEESIECLNRILDYFPGLGSSTEPNPTQLARIFTNHRELYDRLVDALETIKGEYPECQWDEYNVPKMTYVLDKAKALMGESSPHTTESSKVSVEVNHTKFEEDAGISWSESDINFRAGCNVVGRIKAAISKLPQIAANEDALYELKVLLDFIEQRDQTQQQEE